MSRTGRYLPHAVAVLARIAGRHEPGPYRWPLRAVLAVTRCMAWLFWPVSLAVMSRVGRYWPCEVAVLARIAGRYEPCWPLFAVWSGGSGPCRWPLWPVLGVACRVAWLLWPVSVAAMSRSGRYSPYAVAVLARIAGRHEPSWPLFAVRSGDRKSVV